MVFFFSYKILDPFFLSSVSILGFADDELRRRINAAKGGNDDDEQGNLTWREERQK